MSYGWLNVLALLAAVALLSFMVSVALGTLTMVLEGVFQFTHSQVHKPAPKYRPHKWADVEDVSRRRGGLRLRRPSTRICKVCAFCLVAGALAALATQVLCNAYSADSKTMTGLMTGLLAAFGGITCGAMALAMNSVFIDRPCSASDSSVVFGTTSTVKRRVHN